MTITPYIIDPVISSPFTSHYYWPPQTRPDTHAGGQLCDNKGKSSILAGAVVKKTPVNAKKCHQPANRPIIVPLTRQTNSIVDYKDVFKQMKKGFVEKSAFCFIYFLGSQFIYIHSLFIFIFMFRKKKKQCKEESLHGCECPRRGMKKKLFHDKCGCPKLICVGKNINCKSYIYSFIPSLIHLFIRSFIYSKSISLLYFYSMLSIYCSLIRCRSMNQPRT